MSVATSQLAPRGRYMVDSWQSGLLHFVRPITVIQLCILGLLASTIGLPQDVFTDPRSLLILFAPVATIPFFLFFLIQERYRLQALASLVAFGVVAWLAVSLM